MASVNKAILVGNLCGDPGVRYTQSGQAVANFRIACNDAWTDKQGQKQERAEFINVVAWGKTAEIAGEHLQKGRQVYVEGRLQTREWTDKENRKQWTTEVVVDRLVFLGGKGDAGGRDERGPSQSSGGQRSNSGSASGAVFPFGRNKGKPIAGAAIADLEWSADACRRSLADASKANFHAKERALLDAIEAELAKGGAGDDFGPPPTYRDGPTDEDIPF